MSSSPQVSLKLLIDKKHRTILYGEADKNFIDFLFSILALPIGSVIGLLSGGGKVVQDPLRNLYQSIQNLDSNYLQPNQTKDNLLNPKVPIPRSQIPHLFPIESAYSSSSASNDYYKCDGGDKDCQSYVSKSSWAECPACHCFMVTKAKYVKEQGEIKIEEEDGICSKEDGGYVKGIVPYMVMDDLTVKPMSSMSAISLLCELKVEKYLGRIKEKVVYLDINQGVKLLRASMHSTKVLTHVFLPEESS